MPASSRPVSASDKGRVQDDSMPALTQHSTSITLFRISAAMFLNYLTIGIPLVMLPLYVQQQLHLSDLLIGIAVGSQFIATLLTRGAAGRKADTSGGRRTVITGQFYCAASGLLMLVSLIAHPVPLLAWAILIVGRVLLGIGESFILTGNLTRGCGWRARPTRVRLFLERHGDLRCAGYRRAAGAVALRRGRLALPALLVVLLPIIASGVIYGIPGISQQPVPACQCYGSSARCGGPEQGLCSRALVLPP